MISADEKRYLDQNIRLGIKMSMYIKHGASWYEEKTKSEYTVWTITRGTAYITVNKKEYPVPEGSAVLFSPGTAHTARTDENGCEFLFRQFTLDRGGTDLLAERNISGIYENAPIRSRPDPYDLSLLRFSEILSYLTQLIYRAEAGDFTPFGEHASAADPKIYKAASYISENCLSDLSVKDAADLIDLSEKYFIRLFRKAIGIPPKQYIIQCRMRAAAHMLIHSHAPIGDIAEYIGYSDIYSFSKAFKKHYESSPSRFRGLYGKHGFTKEPS